MIGVICEGDALGIVEEFFQLFKTPWELYQTGQTFDVVLVAGEMPDFILARLVLVFGSKVNRSDRNAGLAPLVQRLNARLDWQGCQIPLYGPLLTFGRSGLPTVCTANGSELAALEIELGEPRVVRLGYDLFEEVAFLLRTGQPVENAEVPTLDLHIALLRDLILDSGVSLLEIPPVPQGREFVVSLTHDIDFVGIRRHCLDHTMWGFLHRATLGATRNFLQGKISFGRFMECWSAAAKLPFVYLGWAKDFWMPFEWYLALEKELSPTYFFIPFKRRNGEKVTVPHAERRGCAYDITEVPEWVERLQAEGCEIGVHGIDAWHSVERGREERDRVAAVVGNGEMGIRVHWLLKDAETSRLLEQAGYSYDSTCGYNETPGYRNGTSQVFRPPGNGDLLELPMHIQDGALFYPQRLGLREADAWQRCQAFVHHVRKFGGVLTVLWHDRSHGPERFWGDFYANFIQSLKSQPVWFGTAGGIVRWFRRRRGVVFRSIRGEDGLRRIRLCGGEQPVTPPLQVRISSRGGPDRSVNTVNLAWDGASVVEIHPVAWNADDVRLESVQASEDSRLCAMSTL